MQERQVTIGRETHKVPDPFLVLATQNPIETEGTYALPEAQVDRFMMKVLVGYPTETEEFVIVERMTGACRVAQQVLTTDGLLEMQRAADRVYVDPALMEYAVRAGRPPRRPASTAWPSSQRYITFGASPRASINLILTARALAFVRGRDYALPEDVLDMALDVLRHRLVLSFEALSDDVDSDDPAHDHRPVPVPVVPLRPMTASASAPERILQRLDWQSSAGWTACSRATTGACSAATASTFADLREYQYGDDVRYIDWNVTARMDTPYVREYLEDREITAWFLLDLSPSVDFGTVEAERLKRSVLVDFVTTLARVLTRHGNRVGAVFYGTRVERTIPARGGRVQVLRLINDLLTQPRLPSAPFTDLGAAARGRAALDQGPLAGVRHLGLHQRAGLGASAEVLTQRHEVIAVRLFDRREIELPDVGPMLIEDAETGEQLYVDTHDRAFRRRFEEAAAAREADAAGAFRRAGVDAVALSTDEDLVRGDRPDGRRAAPTAAALTMSFIWPPLLLLLLAIPVGGGVYVDASERRARGRRRLRARPARAARPAARRRAPRAASGAAAPGGLLAWLTVLVLSLARPQSVIGVPRFEGTVILAFDVSGSMAATDVEPTRMEAAKAAARVRRPASRRRPHRRRRVQRQRASRPRSPPTTGPRSSPRSTAWSRSGARRSARGISLARPRSARPTRDPRRPTTTRTLPANPRPAPTPVPARFEPAVIVLLTDGENNQRARSAREAAQAAAETGVRIYTVGIGTTAGTTLEVEGFRVHSQLDEASLRQIAEPPTADVLRGRRPNRADRHLRRHRTRFVIRPEAIEITSLLRRRRARAC